MEEYEQRLTSRNPMLVARTFAQVADVIKNKHKTDVIRKGSPELKELKFLREKCMSSSSLISLTAAKALLTLVSDGVLELNSTISDLISLLINAEGFTGITHAICNLTLLGEGEKYKLLVPQHPLINILLHNSSLWTDVLENFESTEQKDRFREVHRSFFLYVFCDYNKKISSEFKHRLWNFLLEHFWDDFGFFDEILIWQTADDRESLFRLNSYLKEYLTVFIANDAYSEQYFEVVLLMLASTTLDMLRKNMNASSSLDILSCVLTDLKNLSCINSLLYMASEAILICPIVYLENLLRYCKILISLNNTHQIIFNCLKASCLHCVLHQSDVSKNCERYLHEIINYSFTPPSNQNPKLDKLQDSSFNILSNENIHISLEVARFCFNSTEDLIIKWLKSVEKTPEVVLKNLQSLLYGLLLTQFSDEHENENEKIALGVIKIINICVDCYPELSSNFLTMVLYKLANCKESLTHIALLKTLPSLAILKENIGTIVSTLQLFASSQNHPNLRTLSLELFYELWKLQVRSYPLLQNLLTNNLNNNEFNTTKAFVLMKLCETKPELYGTDLAAYLSKILNKCKGSDGGVASSLALLGLKHLCQQELVDIVSAWTALEPSFAQEDRSEVLTSLCHLLSEVSSLPDNSTKYETFINDITNRLWKYATYNNDPLVNVAAFKSLSCFTLKQVSVAVPTVLEDSSIIPDNFGHISGSAWLRLLHTINFNALDALGDLLISLISNEIKSYVKGTYQANENRREPSNFNYLYNHSVVRALGNYLKENSNKLKSLENKFDVYLQVLRVFSQEFPKPLPPFDWCFLQELIHDSATRSYCIKIASKQVTLSGSARRLIENFIVNVTNSINDEDDVLLIYENLSHLLNSIQPMLMEPFFENTTEFAIRTNSKHLLTMLNIVSRLLNNPQILNANKDVLFRIFARELKKKNSSKNEKLYEQLLMTVSYAPEQYLEELIEINPQLTVEELKLSISIRCKTVKNQKEPQFGGFNETVFKVMSIQGLQEYFLKESLSIFALHREHVACYDWFCEFLGEVQLCLGNGKYKIDVEAPFLCDVFILVVVTVAGCEIFGDVIQKSVRMRLFPHALEILVRNKEWEKSIGQILEFLYYMVNQPSLSESIRKTFQGGLVALKHTDLFSDQHRWMKYVCIP